MASSIGVRDNQNIIQNVARHSEHATMSTIETIETQRRLCTITTKMQRKEKPRKTIHQSSLLFILIFTLPATSFLSHNNNSKLLPKITQHRKSLDWWNILTRMHLAEYRPRCNLNGYGTMAFEHPWRVNFWQQKYLSGRRFLSVSKYQKFLVFLVIHLIAQEYASSEAQDRPE